MIVLEKDFKIFFFTLDVHTFIQHTYIHTYIHTLILYMYIRVYIYFLYLIPTLTEYLVSVSTYKNMSLSFDDIIFSYVDIKGGGRELLGC